MSKHLSPNQILRKRADTTTRKTVARILEVWDSASATNREDGAQWYPLHTQLVIRLSRDWYVSEEHAAAVLSHLSPRVQWDKAIAAAPVILSGQRPSGILGDRIEACQQALRAVDPLTTFGGPKTRNFYLNLIGDLDAVTVDVWAWRIALGEHDVKVESRAGVYDAVAHCYRLAAAKRGVRPSTMQAATWCALRGRSDLTPLQ